MHPNLTSLTVRLLIPAVVGKWLVTIGTIGPPSTGRTIALVIGCALLVVPIAVVVLHVVSMRSHPKPSYAEDIRQVPACSALFAGAMSFGMVVEFWLRDAPKVILFTGSPDIGATILALVAIGLSIPIYWVFRWQLRKELRKRLGPLDAAPARDPR